MNTPPQHDAFVLLCDRQDWTTWIFQIQGRAAAYNIWDNIKLDCPVPFLEKPTRPILPSLSRYYRGTSIQEPSNPSELSPQDLEAYKEEMERHRALTEEYKLDYSEYKTQQKSICHLTELIQSTVLPHLQRTSCFPGRSLQEWIFNLKVSVGVDDLLERERARDRYRDALKPMRNYNTWETWLAEYDQASSRAATQGVADALQIQVLMRDFINAVSKLEPIWAATFQNSGRLDPLMTRKEMIRLFRSHMNLCHPPMTGEHRAGAFATPDDASFLADVEAAAQRSKRDAPSAMDSAPSAKRAKRKPAPPSNKRSSKNETENTKRRCPVCGCHHGVEECWYIHDEKAPTWWRPTEAMHSLVAYRKQNDPEFQNTLRGPSDLFASKVKRENDP
ncbi:hypothetical protein E4U27_005716 [Claviceps purpurea]|nr:hypothetical protein E4U27_005716 [Claviceps purpurea]